MRATLIATASLVTMVAVPVHGSIFDVSFNELSPGLAPTQPVTDQLPLTRPTNVVLDFPNAGDTIEIVSDAGNLTDQPVLLEAQPGGISWGGFLTPDVYTSGMFSVSWDSLVMSLPESGDPKPFQGVQVVTRSGDPGNPSTLQIEERWQLRYTPELTFEISDFSAIQMAGSYVVGQADHFDLDFNLDTGKWDLELNGNSLVKGTIVAPFEFGGVVFTTNGRGRTTAPAALVMDDLLIEAVGLPGDYNGNGLVEQADLDLVLLHWGDDTPPIPSGWIVDSPQGSIDQAELDGVLLNWGASAAGSHTPEPSTLALLVLAAIVALGWRRKFVSA